VPVRQGTSNGNRQPVRALVSTGCRQKAGLSQHPTTPLCHHGTGRCWGPQEDQDTWRGPSGLLVPRWSSSSDVPPPATPSPPSLARPQAKLPSWGRSCRRRHRGRWEPWGNPRRTEHHFRAASGGPSPERLRGRTLGGRCRRCSCREGRGGDGSPESPRYLLVALQLAGEGALVEEELQALLGVVVAELLEGGPPALPRQLGVLRPGGVHHRHRAHRVLARLQRPAWDRGTPRGEWVLPGPPGSAPGPPARTC